MSGRELKQLAESVPLRPEEISVESGISVSTLYKVFNGDHVRETTRIRVERAIKALSAKGQAS